jgi:hypothetical protein
MPSEQPEYRAKGLASGKRAVHHETICILTIILFVQNLLENSGFSSFLRIRTKCAASPECIALFPSRLAARKNCAPRFLKNFARCEVDATLCKALRHLKPAA